MFHIGRGSTNLGSFSQDEVRIGLRSGRFLRTDLGWTEGMANWKPLAEFELFAAPPPLPAPVEIPTPEPEEGRPGLPWEHRRELGFGPAFLGTVKQVLTGPSTAFSRVRLVGGLAEPLIYNIVGGWTGLVVMLAFQAAFLKFQPTPAAAPNAPHNPFLLTSDNAVAALVMGIVLGPVFVVLGAFIGSFVTHFCLIMLRGANKPYEATLRVFSYASGSAQFLQIIPIFGGLFAAILQLVCLTVGLSRVHEISVARAVGTVALLMVVAFAAAVSLATVYVLAVNGHV